MLLHIININTANTLYRVKSAIHIPSVGEEIFLPNTDDAYIVLERSFHYYDNDHENIDDDSVLILVELNKSL